MKKIHKWLSVILVLAMTFSTVFTNSALVMAAENTDQKDFISGNVSSTESYNETETENDLDSNEDNAEESTEESEEESTEELTEETEEKTEESTEETEEESTEESTEESEEESTEELIDELQLQADLSWMEVTDYDSFLSDLEILENYADDYVQENGGEATALVINFIRTGVERYTSDSWAIMAGNENTLFTEYVAGKDVENETTASALKNLNNFALPNGDTVDFGHMFGCMDVAYYAKTQGTTAEVAKFRADMSSWAGDICDLMTFANGKISSEDLEEMTKEVKDSYLGVDSDEDHSFGQLDIYGDLDAFYILDQIDKTDNKISIIMASYFTGSLSDQDRADYFMKNRLNGAVTQNGIRSAILKAYTSNTLLTTLEASRGLSDCEQLRTACCYAFSDYLFELAGDDSGEDPGEDPGTDPGGDDNFGGEEEKPSSNPYYSVFSSNTTTLAPGITQNIKYALTADDKQIVYYTATIDVARDDVNIYANYHDNDGSAWAMSRVSDQMAAAQVKHSNPDDPDHYIENYNTIVGVNADFYNMSTGAPSGALVMEGVEYHGVGSENFFAILKDGTAIIGGSSEWKQYKDQIQEAVGGSIYLVKNGEIAVNASTNYYNNRASRTCVGITAKGEVVLMVLDGRQEPFSAGGSAEEIAQIMLEAGCVTAINLDGGGSTTFAAKQEGEDEVTVVNRPSDGYERSVSSSLLVVSTAKTSNEFDHALIETETDYLTVGSALALTTTGVSESGNAAAVPEDAYWKVSNEQIGFVKEDVFTAVKSGETELSLVVDDQVVGTKTIYVVTPDELSFKKSSMDVVYGHETELPLTAFYRGNPVTIQEKDVVFELSAASAGTMNGFSFTGKEESGIRNVKVTAKLSTDYSISASISLSLYGEDEAIFDFETAMMGDQAFAWNREVSNATTSDNSNYYIVKEDQSMETSYVFALDMREIAIPEKLNDLVYMIAGGDLESATAWNFLLQLAERVSSLTKVTVPIQFDSDVDVDYSDLTIVNDYFKLSNAEMDEKTNTLTVTINWIKQTEAIPAETANPICILSGLKLTPKKGASWDSKNNLAIVNTGSLNYDIYLRASSLYSMANQESFQKQYDIYPYANPDNSADKGGHFASEYLTFEDSYTLNRTIKQGWAEYNDNLYYYVDNVPLTGIQKLPGYGDEEHEYYYDLGENGACLGKVNGLFSLNGNKYYAVNGILKSSWRVITDDKGKDQYYYFDRKTYQAVDGEQNISGYDYVFENNILVKGCWIKEEGGMKYVWAGHMMQNEWFDVEGDQYFAYAYTCYIAVGIKKTLNHERTGEEVYVFDEQGRWLEDFSGFYEYEGSTYLVKDGVRVAYPGLVEIDGDYYYFNSSHTMIKDKDYYVSKSNNLMAAGKYTFGADGKMMKPGEGLNGIVKESDTLWYYYVDGAKNYAGLIEIDGEYYYVNSSFQVIHDCSYFISKTNGLMKQASYSFDADGKMIKPGEGIQGIVKESDTLWYYYVDGAKTYAGLIEIDGEYYYVNSSFQVIHDQTYYVSKNNGLMPQTYYSFDADGKMILNKDADGNVKNGIVKETDDLWYYYVNGVKTYAGLIEIDGDYYYVNSAFEVIHAKKYYISKTNNLLPQASYTFDEEGKMAVK